MRAVKIFKMSLYETKVSQHTLEQKKKLGTQAVFTNVFKLNVFNLRKEIPQKYNLVKFTSPALLSHPYHVLT